MIQPMVPEPESAPQLIHGINVDAISAAVADCVDVEGLDGGPFDAVASYLPGRRVPGVRVRPDRITVQVRTRWGVPMTQVATQLRIALAPLLGDHGLDIVISDISDPPERRLDAAVNAGQQNGEVPWMSSSAEPEGPGSGNTTPTVVETQTYSQTASPPSTAPS